MQRRNFFQRLTDSLFRPQFAYDVVYAHKSEAWPYFFKLTGLLSLLLLIVMLLSAYPLGGLALLLRDLDEGIADFSLQNNRLTIDSKEPIVFQAGIQVMIADNDPTAAILDEYAGFAGQVLYFGPDSVITMSAGQRLPMPYELLGWTFNKADLLNLVSQYAWLFLLLTSIFMFISKAAAGLFYALVIAALSLILNAATKLNAPFQKLYALSLFALTGVFIVETVFGIVNWFTGEAVALPSAASYLVTLVFMGFYVFSAKKMSDAGSDISPQ